MCVLHEFPPPFSFNASVRNILGEVIDRANLELGDYTDPLQLSACETSASCDNWAEAASRLSLFYFSVCVHRPITSVLHSGLMDSV